LQLKKRSYFLKALTECSKIYDLLNYSFNFSFEKLRIFTFQRRFYFMGADPFATGTPVQVKITTRFYYIYGRYSCSIPSDIGSGNQLGDGSSIDSLNGSFWSIFANVYCTDFSIPFQWQAGTREQMATVESGFPVLARFSSCCWIINTVTVDGTDSWKIDVTIDLTKRDATGQEKSNFFNI